MDSSQNLTTYPKEYIDFLERHYEACNFQTWRIMKNNNNLDNKKEYKKLLMSFLHIELMKEDNPMSQFQL